ncbi:hypothetical protein [Enterococcus faecium]|uniref:hypothetical protein n=1 Tax=Enterococcus faecium TaxID=1352 RepID=UPI000A352D59|nr:hypothetical protein [Enterococcus faecium]OTO49797.1 hypothetical protein A5814_002885 [Enterococcus faecium]
MTNPFESIPVDLETNAQFSALLDIPSSKYFSEEDLLKALVAAAVDKLSEADRKDYERKLKDYTEQYEKWATSYK